MKHKDLSVGKISPLVQDRSIKRRISPRIEDFILGADVAEDSSALAVRDGGVVVFSGRTSPAVLPLGVMEIFVNVVEALWCKGSAPRGILASVLFPLNAREDGLRLCTDHLETACKAYHMELAGVNCCSLPGVLTPILSLNGIGTAPLNGWIGNQSSSEKKRREERRAFRKAGGLGHRFESGDTLVITHQVALAGANLLVQQHQKVLEHRFSSAYLDRMKEKHQFYVMKTLLEHPEILHWGKAYPIGEGGVLSALWRMGQEYEIGLEVDLQKIPLYQETIELCEYLGINPYYLWSGDSIIMGTKYPDALLGALHTIGISGSIIGKCTEGKACILRRGEEIRYLDTPQPDSYYEEVLIHERENFGTH